VQVLVKGSGNQCMLTAWLSKCNLNPGVKSSLGTKLGLTTQAITEVTSSDLVGGRSLPKLASHGSGIV